MADPKITGRGASRPRTDSVVAGKKHPDRDKPSDKVITSGLQRHGRLRSSSIRRKDENITSRLVRSNSVRINRTAAAGTMTGEHLMAGLGPGHDVGRLLLQLFDAKTDGHMLMQELANISQGGGEGYERQFKQAVDEQYESVHEQQKDAIAGKLTSSQMHALRWSLLAAARQDGASPAARMSFMLEALCARFEAGDVKMAVGGSDRMAEQLKAIVGKFEQARRQAKGSLDASKLQGARVSYNLDPGSLERFPEDSRKGVCTRFRDLYAGSRNIYVKGSDKPVNGASIQGRSKAGSGDLIELCSNNKRMSLAASRALVALHDPQAASDIFGDRLGLLPLPEINGKPAENVTFGSTKQHVELEKAGKDRIRMRVHIDAVLDVAAAKSRRGEVALEAKLNPAQSDIALDLHLEVNGKGEVKPVRMDYSYRAQPVIGISAEDRADIARQAKTVARKEADAINNPQPPAGNEGEEQATRRRLPPTPGQSGPPERPAGRSRSTSISKVVKRFKPPSSAPAADKIRSQPKDATPRTEDSVGVQTPRPAGATAAPPPSADDVARNERKSAIAAVLSKAQPVAPQPADILTMESPVWLEEEDAHDVAASASNDVLSGINGVVRLVDGLIENDAAGAAGALQMLASSGASADAPPSEKYAFSNALARYVASLDTHEHSQLVRAITGPEVTAAKSALSQPSQLSGIEPIRNQVKHVSSIIDQIRRAAGVASLDVQPPTASQQESARAAVEMFVREAEQNSSEVTYPPLGVDAQNRFSAADLGSIQADGQHEYVCKDLLDEARDASCRIVQDDGSRRWLMDPTFKPFRSRQDTAERLLAFCDGNRQQALSLSRVLVRETGELIKPAEVQLRAVQSDPPLGFSVHKRDDGSIEVTVDCSCALREYDPDDDSQRPRQYNPNFSSWRGQLRLQVAPDGAVAPIADSRQAVLVERQGEVSDFADYRAKVEGYSEEIERGSAEFAENMLEIIKLIDFEQNLRAESMATDPRLVREGMGSLADAGALDARQVAFVNQRLEVMAEMERCAASMMAEQAAGGGDSRQLAEYARNCMNDLELMQREMDANKLGWVRGDMARASIFGIHTVLNAMKTRMGTLAAGMRTTAERADAAGRSLPGQPSPAARVAAARLQTEAAYAAVVEAFADALDAGLQLGDAQTDLLQELSRRRRLIIEDEARVLAGEDPKHEYGIGADDRQFEDAARQISLNLKSFQPLPAAHAQLSEEQLVQTRIEHFVSENPSFRDFFSGFSECRAAHLTESINSRDWGTVKERFVDSFGSASRTVESAIVPAAGFEEESFAAGYGGVNAAPGSHFTGTHAVNLAHSQLKLAKEGSVLYRGLRHGIADNYLLTAESVRATSRNNRARLYDRILRDSQQWRQWAAENGGGSRQKDLALLRTHAGSDFAAPILRQQANLNAAREVIRASVVSDPQLLAAAQRGEDVSIAVNAISMVTPAAAADAESSRHKLASHRRALQDAASGPIELSVLDEQGSRKTLKINARVRTINCQISPNNGLFRPPPEESDAARLQDDDESVANLEEMIGPLADDETGGAAAARAAELEADGSSDSGTAFGIKADLAAAIRRLASQLRSIFRSGSHLQPGGDPYQAASRLALLSFLLGDGTSACCETGSGRTGSLDSQVKYLAATMASGRYPEPDSGEDWLRQADYLLRAGNSRFHNAVSGGQFGSRIDDPAPARSKFNDPAARPLE